MRKNWIYLFAMILMLVAINYIGRTPEESEVKVQPEVSAAGGAGVQADSETAEEEFNTIEEAKRNVSFDINIPSFLVKEYARGKVFIAPGQIIEIHFYGSNNQIIFRAGQGLGNISGDYTLYENEENIECRELTVKAKGNDGAFSLIYFTADDLKYAMSFEKPVERQEVIDIVDNFSDELSLKEGGE